MLCIALSFSIVMASNWRDNFHKFSATINIVSCEDNNDLLGKVKLFQTMLSCVFYVFRYLCVQLLLILSIRTAQYNVVEEYILFHVLIVVSWLWTNEIAHEVTPYAKRLRETVDSSGNGYTAMCSWPTNSYQ